MLYISTPQANDSAVILSGIISTVNNHSLARITLSSICTICASIIIRS